MSISGFGNRKNGISEVILQTLYFCFLSDCLWYWSCFPYSNGNKKITREHHLNFPKVISLHIYLSRQNVYCIFFVNLERFTVKVSLTIYGKNLTDVRFHYISHCVWLNLVHLFNKLDNNEHKKKFFNGFLCDVCKRGRPTENISFVRRKLMSLQTKLQD